MPDGSPPPDNTLEAERRVARRVLRAARTHREASRGVRRKWLAWALAAAPLLGAALWIQAQNGVMERPGAERVVDADVSAADANGFAGGAGQAPIRLEIETAARVPPAALEQRRAEGPVAGAAMSPPLPSADAADISRGLLMIDPVAGNPFDLRASDVIIDLCDQPGSETALEISAALAADASSCLIVSRDNVLVRTSLRRSAGDGVREPEL